MSDIKGRSLIINITIDIKKFVLINLYNLNTENEKVEVLHTLLTLIEPKRKLKPFTRTRLQRVF